MSGRVVETTCHELRNQLLRAIASGQIDLLRQAIDGSRPLTEQLMAWSGELHKMGCHLGSVECWAMSVALTFEIRRAERLLAKLERVSAA